MTCPNCKVDLSCPCKACVAWRKKTGKLHVLNWEWLTGDEMMCPMCGFSNHADFWEEYEFYLWDKQRNRLSAGQEEFIMEVLEEWRKNNV